MSVTAISGTAETSAVFWSCTKLGWYKFHPTRYTSCPFLDICSVILIKPQAQIPLYIHSAWGMHAAHSALEWRAGKQLRQAEWTLLTTNLRENCRQHYCAPKECSPNCIICSHHYYSDILTGSSPCQGFGLIKVNPKVKSKSVMMLILK